jgi:hypothetical protein
MLTDVTIEGLRGVGKVELKFAPDQHVHTLFGENGVGKTKCLEALFQYLLASNKDFVAHCKKTALPATWPVMTRMQDVPGTQTFEVAGEPAQQPISQVWGKQSAGDLYQLPVVFLGAGRRASLEKTQAQGGLGAFAERRRKYFNVLFQAFQSGDLSSLGMAGDTRGWFVARAQSANPYQKSKDNRHAEIDAVLSMLHAIEPSIDAQALQIDGDGQVFLSIDGESRELGELSSGFVALVKLVQAIVAGYAAFTNEIQLQRVRGIVLIDEIEAHLHPAWQTQIIPCLKTLLPNTIFYVATHSPLVLPQLKDGEAYVLKRDENDGVVRSEMMEGTSRRIFEDVLKSALGVDLSRIKRDFSDPEQNQRAKQRLRDLIHEARAAEAAEVNP